MTRAPYGTWESPITSDEVTAKSVLIDDVVVDHVKGKVYHLERRPAEAGRSVLVDTATGKDVVPAGFNVRSQVQEYGGGAVFVHDGFVYVSKFDDRHVYRIINGHEPEIVTPESAVWRYADFTAHPSYSHLLVCVQEDHTDPTPSGVQTRLVVINTDTKVVTTFAEGADFYSAPRFSPNGSALAWLQWNHPDMPWEGAQLHIAPITVAESKLGSDADSGDVDIKLGTITRVAGEPGQVAANYPLWSPAGASLHFTCDISGFANPWIWSRDAGARSTIHVPLAEEFGLPAWHLDEMYAASLDEDKTLHVAVRGGRSVLYIIEHGVAQEVTSPYTSVRSVRRVGPGQVVFLGATATASAAVIHATFDLDHDASSSASFPIFKTLYSLSDSASTLQPPTLSSPESLTFDGPSGPVHAVFWPPHNPAYEGSDREGDLPPCVFAAHGGPTHHKDPSMNGEVAFYTSRGWGWCEVNYGGSSGYGRAYTERLKGQWGVVDVQDVLASALALSTGPDARVDPKRLAIRGGSSGGYTVLATLVYKERPDAFAAGTSYYGISDLKALGEFTHKFESKYLDGFLGGTYSDVPDVYRERSPVHHADQIVSPLLILQGSADAVVPPPQSEAIVEAVKQRDGDIEYIVFEGEGHGFRKAESLKKALESELAFYERVLKLKA